MLNAIMSHLGVSSPLGAEAAAEESLTKFSA